MKAASIFIPIVIAIGVTASAFQAGRLSDRRKPVTSPTADLSIAQSERRGHASASKTRDQVDAHDVIIRNVATVPFSELYDIMRAASADQILRWANDLENLPAGPRRLAALKAFYKTLVQIDAKMAGQAVLRTKSRAIRDVEIEAMIAAAPESVWGEIGKTLIAAPHREGRAYDPDLIWNWSRVDPIAAGRFLEEHPQSDRDNAYYALLYNWSAMDPAEGG